MFFARRSIESVAWAGTGSANTALGAFSGPNRALAKERTMSTVDEVMSKVVFSCQPTDSLNECARLMWEHDCGCVPVVDGLAHVVGILTDRDVCMAAYTQGRPLTEIHASALCNRDVFTCRPSDTLEQAEAIMTKHQTRRLPVVDEEQGLVGMLSLSDLVQHMRFVDPATSHPLGPGDLALVLESVTRAREPVSAK
jgi:CBS domain-containing protein